MEYEVACVDVTPLGEAKRSDIVTVGLWTDISVRVLRLPTLDPLHTEPLQGGEPATDIYLYNCISQFFFFSTLHSIYKLSKKYQN